MWTGDCVLQLLERAGRLGDRVRRSRIELLRRIPLLVVKTSRRRKQKADVTEHPQVCGHVGLLVNKPPGAAGMPFI